MTDKINIKSNEDCRAASTKASAMGVAYAERALNAEDPGEALTFVRASCDWFTMAVELRKVRIQ